MNELSKKPQGNGVLPCVGNRLSDLSLYKLYKLRIMYAINVLSECSNNKSYDTAEIIEQFIDAEIKHRKNGC